MSELLTEHIDDEAYDFINEALSHEPDYIKIMKWAISIHFNSPKPDANGNPQASHIGNYFSTVRFKDWKYDYEPKDGRPTQFALFYEGSLKSTLVHGSTTVEDRKNYTIVYALDGISEIKTTIKADKELMKCLESGHPSKDAAPALHGLAEEFVRYAQFYIPGEEIPELTVKYSQLANLGQVLVNSPLLPKGIKRTGEKGSRSSGGWIGPSTGYIYTINADKVRAFNALKGPSGNLIKPLTEIDKDGKEREVHKPGGADTYTRKDENGNWICGIATGNSYAKLYVQRLKDEGIIDSYKQGSLLNSTGERTITGGIRSVMEKEDKPAKTKSGSPRAAKATTLACDSGSFERIAQIASRLITSYNMDHANAANVDANDSNESITITGMNQKALDQLTAILDKRGLKYSKI